MIFVAQESRWVQTEWGEVLHAYSAVMGTTLCGLSRPRWFPVDVDAPLCDYCGSAYGPSFPKPPGRVHHLDPKLIARLSSSPRNRGKEKP